MSSFISRLFKSRDPVIIDPYGGYANNEFIFATARVLEDEGITHGEDDGVIRNIWNSFKRLESDEIEDAKVHAYWGTRQASFVSDEEGYVHMKIPHGIQNFHEISQFIPVSLRLEHGHHQYNTSMQILKPGSAVEFGVISDMDDTVIQTGVSSRFKWRLLVNSVGVNARKRRPLDGAQAFYQALHVGKALMNSNPFFYVSNSPWNLHEYLCTFLRHNNFPEGPLILRDLGLHSLKSKKMEDSAKYRSIVQILEAYPKMTFVLIGDAAEVDADIYLSLAKDFSQQIRAIFIRTVTDEAKVARVKKLIEAQTDVEALLVEDGEEAMAGARQLGLI